MAFREVSVLQLQPQTGQTLTQHAQRPFGLPSAVADRHQIIGIADQHPVALAPCPVEPVQVDVGEQRGDHPNPEACRSPDDGPCRR
jgi:hypothetical protein